MHLTVWDLNRGVHSVDAEVAYTSAVKNNWKGKVNISGPNKINPVHSSGHTGCLLKSALKMMGQIF